VFLRVFFLIVESLVVSIEVQPTVWKNCEVTCCMSSYTLYLRTHFLPCRLLSFIALEQMSESIHPLRSRYMRLPTGQC